MTRRKKSVSPNEIIKFLRRSASPPVWLHYQWARESILNAGSTIFSEELAIRATTMRFPPTLYVIKSFGDTLSGRPIQEES